MKYLKGKVAVVTGSGRGIGKAIALELAYQGAKVVINDPGVEIDGRGRDKKPAANTVTEIKKHGWEAVANFDSVANEAGATRIINTAIKNFGRLDILVNNAGILQDNRIFDMTNREWDTVIKVHLYGNFYCSRAACKIFKTQKSGRIISVSSPTTLGFPGRSNYASAKAGILGFVRSIALDMAEYGVTVNAIWPNSATRLTIPQNQLANLTNGESSRNNTLPDPEYVSPLVAYLASDAAAYIKGQTFDIFESKITLISPETESRSLYKDGKWTVPELIDIFPVTIGKNLVQPCFSPPV